MIVSRNSIALAPKYNTKGRRDATGAFQPEAKRFLKFHGLPPSNLFKIDNKQSPVKMRRQVVEIIEEAASRPFDGTPVVAFFCHGTSRAIQFGFTASSVKTLAKVIGLYSRNTVRVPLYACLTGKANGFAFRLLAALCWEGLDYAVVDSHTTRGHTTRNPYVRRYDAMGSLIGNQGGYDVVYNTKKDLWKAWRASLRGNMRFLFPTLKLAEIHAQL